MTQETKYKKWALRIHFSVTISYLYYILPHTLVWQTVKLSAASPLDLGYSSFNIASVVLGLKLPSVTDCCSFFTVLRVFFSLVL